MHILLADDNPEIRSALSLLLRTRIGDVMISEASAMREVWSQVAIGPLDGIILDWDLIGKPVPEAMAALRAILPDLRIVVINTRPEIEKQVLAAGADAFVCKTDSPDKLLGSLYRIFPNLKVNSRPV
ncbi:MAG: response regulator [Anaerolineales bacterium]|nr:response regulator [Anaerolineales bacterium]